jgi:hypothetical protein
LTITDVLGFYDDALGIYLPDPDLTRRNTTESWFRVPVSWLEAGTLPRARMVQIYGFFYGEDWLYSRERSKYLVLEEQVHVLSPDECIARPWQGGVRLYALTGDAFVRMTADQF